MEIIEQSLLFVCCLSIVVNVCLVFILNRITKVNVDQAHRVEELRQIIQRCDALNAQLVAIEKQTREEYLKLKEAVKEVLEKGE